MVQRLLLRPNVQSYVFRSVSNIHTQERRKQKFNSLTTLKQDYERITKNQFRQRLNNDFKSVPIAKDYFKAKKEARNGSFDRLQDFQVKYSEHGFNENIPFYLYPRFVYIICTSNKARLWKKRNHHPAHFWNRNPFFSCQKSRWVTIPNC